MYFRLRLMSKNPLNLLSPYSNNLTIPSMKAVYSLLTTLLLPFCVSAASFVYSSNVAQVICEDSQGYSYEERFRMIHTLDKNISAGDVDYYFNFLSRPFKGDDLRAGEFDTLKNDLADKLLVQHRLPKNITGRFLHMIDQKALGVVWRDYVLQKLPDLYKRVETEDRVRILKKLWESADSVEHTFSGTALLSLSRMDRLYPGVVVSERFAERALAVVQGVAFSDQNKITALQLLAESRHPEALNLARKILDAESTVMLRVSAIGVLGIMGQSADKEDLLYYANSPEFRLRRAAKAALQRLDGYS